jgi:class 3 adenylate cyclase
MGHFRQARRIKDLCDGYEIKPIGDAYMAAFRTAVDAFQFAWQFYNDTSDPQIRIRIGIHVGQVRIVENDTYGLMVNYTSRVQHALRGMGIMLSDAAKTDVLAELGKEVQEFSLIPLRKQLKGFGAQNLWFVSKKLTPLQESTFGKVFRKVMLNETESDLVPPVPGAHKGRVGGYSE